MELRKRSIGFDNFLFFIDFSITLRELSYFYNTCCWEGGGGVSYFGFGTYTQHFSSTASDSTSLKSSMVGYDRLSSLESYLSTGVIYAANLEALFGVNKVASEFGLMLEATEVI
jgi:hypothetical protein